MSRGGEHVGRGGKHFEEGNRISRCWRDLKLGGKNELARCLFFNDLPELWRVGVRFDVS